MKAQFIFLLTLGFMSLTVWASDIDLSGYKGTLACKSVSDYFKLPDIKLNLADQYLFFGQDENKITIGWSVTECEDDSVFTFSKKDFATMVKNAGKKVYVQFEHHGPETELKTIYECSYQELP